MRWGISGSDSDGDRINSNTIHVSWMGGYEGHDTRTAYQKSTMKLIADMLVMMCPEIEIVGHNQFSAKSCPNFDVKKEFAYIND